MTNPNMPADGSTPVILKSEIEYNDDDSWTVTFMGKRYKVEMPYDHDSKVDDADCYSEEDIEAWRNDEWWFVGIIVTPLDVPESVQFDLSDDLWGLEFDFPIHESPTGARTDANYQITQYPVPDMLMEVDSKVKAWELRVAIESVTT